MKKADTYEVSHQDAIQQIMLRYGIDRDEAEYVREIMLGRGISEEDAFEVFLAEY